MHGEGGGGGPSGAGTGAGTQWMGGGAPEREEAGGGFPTREHPPDMNLMGARRGGSPGAPRDGTEKSIPTNATSADTPSIGDIHRSVRGGPHPKGMSVGTPRRTRAKGKTPPRPGGKRITVLL